MQRILNTGTDHLLATIVDGVAMLTLNRPERRNAFSLPMLEALAVTLAACEADAAVGCVVVTGSGPAFCAGGDVKDMAAAPALNGPELERRIHGQRASQLATSGRLHKMLKPTIASLPGPAAGAGLSLALACDFRIAADTAILTTAFARVGLSGDFGGAYFLTRLVGSAKARELLFLSEQLSMADAVRLGLVNWAVPPAELTEKTLELARRLASGPRVAYRYMKENLNRATTCDLDDCMNLEVTHHVHTALTDDHAEAARAFVEKRSAVFRGQ
jgi:2-(1,2-epoxy-1,2-dihydrophenyl)acetyl-CoA isomerase